MSSHAIAHKYTAPGACFIAFFLYGAESKGGMILQPDQSSRTLSKPHGHYRLPRSLVPLFPAFSFPDLQPVQNGKKYNGNQRIPYCPEQLGQPAPLERETEKKAVRDEVDATGQK